MLISSLLYATGGQCVLSFERQDGWIQATWSGHIGPAEAISGATSYLQKAAQYQTSCLLNNNLALQGPWFDSLDWLEHVWLPQAMRIGLRYVAHVVQADTHADILTFPVRPPFQGGLELQLFDALPEAEEWLRTCCQPPD